MNKFDWREEERIFEIVSTKVRSIVGCEHCSTSIVWRRGNDFVVAAWYDVPIEKPKWETDTRMVYTRQHVHHVCMRVFWKGGKRFLKVIEAHEGANLTWHGKFTCGSCACELGHRELY